MDRALVRIVVVLIVIAVVAFPFVARSMDIWKTFNESIPNITYTGNFDQLKQPFRGSTHHMFEGLKLPVPKGENECYQHLPSFGDFFKFYRLKMTVVTEDDPEGPTLTGGEKIVYFRVGDSDDQFVNSDKYNTSKIPCVMLDNVRAPFVTTNVILERQEFKTVEIWKDENLGYDNYFVKIDDKEPEKISTGDFEKAPLIYTDDTHSCLVFRWDKLPGSDNVKRCKPVNLEEVKDLFVKELKACDKYDDECVCALTISDKDVNIEINNLPGKSTIAFSAEGDSLVHEADFMFDFYNEDYTNVHNPYNLEELGYDYYIHNRLESRDGQILRSKYAYDFFNYFSGGIIYGGKNKLLSANIKEMSGNEKLVQINVEDDRLYFYKPEKVEISTDTTSYVMYQELGAEEVRHNTWDYYIFKNDINAEDMCG